MADRVDPSTGRVIKPGERRVQPTAGYSGRVVERKNRASEKPKDFTSPPPAPKPGTPEFDAWVRQGQMDTSGQVSGLSSYQQKPREASSGSTPGKISLDEHGDATKREISAAAAAKADIASDPDFAEPEDRDVSPAAAKFSRYHSFMGGAGYRHPADPEPHRDLIAESPVPALSEKASTEEKAAHAAELSSWNSKVALNSNKLNALHSKAGKAHEAAWEAEQERKKDMGSQQNAARTTETPNKAAEDTAARQSQRRSAASAAPVKPAATPAVSNPAPQAPAPASNATPAAPSAPTDQPQPLKKVMGKGIPSKDTGLSPGSQVSSAPERHWLTPAVAARAKKRMEASTSKPAPEPQPATAPTRGPDDFEPPVPVRKSAPAPVSNLGPTAQAKVNRATAAAKPQPSTPVPQKTPVAAPQAAAAQAATSAHTPFTGTPAQVNAVKQGMAAAWQNAFTGSTLGKSMSTTNPNPPSGKGRTGSAPRVEVGGGRVSAGAAGGIHMATEGNNNYSHINASHNTTVYNYGSMSGSSIGNQGGGYPRGSTGASSRRGPEGHGGDHEGHEGEGIHGDIWYRDAHGHHSLSGAAGILTGKTDVGGTRLSEGKKNAAVTAPSPVTPATAGAQQKPLKGSPRAAGSAQSSAQQGTGTTMGQQATPGGVQHPASGIGTATYGQYAPQKKTTP